MAAVMAPMQTEIADITKKAKKGGKSITPPKIAKAIVTTYMKSAQNSMAFPVTQIAGESKLREDLKEIFSKPKKAGKTITPLKIAKAIVECTGTLMTQHQTAIVSQAGLTQLKSDIESCMSKPTKNKTKFAREFAKAVDTYFKSCNITGVIPGSPPIPFAGSPV